MPSQPRILIYGAGAVGQAIGGMLAAAEAAKVDMIMRPRFIEAIKAQGLSISGLYGEHHVSAGTIGLSATLDELPGARFDFAIITTKAYDTKKAVADLKRLPDQTFTVVTMQNGCGNLETVAENFGEARALGARIITGCEITAPAHVRITVSADATHIGGSREGSVPEQAQRLADILNGASLPCVATPYIRRDLFAKLLYNCALNPLGAILGVNYGALADHRSSRAIMDRVINETFAVIRAMGAETHWQNAAAYRDFFYGQQVPATYGHRPSMLQDIENHKPTEVEALTGYVAAQGRKHGVQTPACDLLSELVRFKEGQEPAG